MFRKRTQYLEEATCCILADPASPFSAPLPTFTSPSSTPTPCPGSTSRCSSVRLTWLWGWLKTESAWSLCYRYDTAITSHSRLVLSPFKLFSCRCLTNSWAWPAQLRLRNTRATCGARCFCRHTPSSNPSPTSLAKTSGLWSSSGCILPHAGIQPHPFVTTKAIIKICCCWKTKLLC